MKNSVVEVIPESFIDGLLWIGGSYRQIQCRSDDNCAPKGRARCFVHEAAWRGISRKVAHVPKWAIPGQSKIFLVHRGGFKARYKGKIFGYFCLHRVEVLSNVHHPASSPDVDEEFGWSGPPGQGRLTVTVYDAFSGRQIRGAEVHAGGGDQPLPTKAVEKGSKYALDLMTGDCSLDISLDGYGAATLKGVRVPNGKRRNVHVYLKPNQKETEVRKKRCWDGTDVVTHRYVSGRWKPTGKDCPDPPDPDSECNDGGIEWDMCPDGTLIPVRICVNGEWVDTSARCPDLDDGNGAGDDENDPSDDGHGGGDGNSGGNGGNAGKGGNGGDGSEDGNDGQGTGGGTKVDIGSELFALHRSCSLRLRPQAVYLVDSLAAEITDRFSAALWQTGLREQYQSARNEQERERCALAGRDRHREVIDSINDGRESQVRIDVRIDSMAELRGDLVVFNKPVTFVKYPTASFRSLERIDGENLLDQISREVGQPTIRIWTQPAKTASPTRSAIEARLAGNLGMSLAITHRFLDELVTLAKRELTGRGVFKLQDMGILWVAGQTQDHRPRPMARSDIVASLQNRLKRKDPKTGESIPMLKRAAINRLLDELSQLGVEQLQEPKGALRLPRFGTFRTKKGRVVFAPAKDLQACGEVVLESFPGIRRQAK